MDWEITKKSLTYFSSRDQMASAVDFSLQWGSEASNLDAMSRVMANKRLAWAMVAGTDSNLSRVNRVMLVGASACGMTGEWNSSG